LQHRIQCGSWRNHWVNGIFLLNSKFEKHWARSIARERNRILRELAAEKKNAFMRSFVGREVEAITLNVFDGTHTECLTDNFLKLKLTGKHDANQWLRPRVDQMQDAALVA